MISTLKRRGLADPAAAQMFERRTLRAIFRLRTWALRFQLCGKVLQPHNFPSTLLCGIFLRGIAKRELTSYTNWDGDRTSSVTLSTVLIVSSSQAGRLSCAGRAGAFFLGGTTAGGAGGSAARFRVIGTGFGFGGGGSVLAAGGGVGAGPDDEGAGVGLDELEARPCSLASRFKRIYPDVRNKE